MQEQDRLKPGDRELELALKSVFPSAARIDAVAAAFAAGQRSCRRQTRFWQSAAAVMLLVGAGSWMLPGSQQITPPSRQLVETVVTSVGVHPQPGPMPAQSLLILEDAMRQNGLEGLPAPNLPTIQPTRPTDSL